MQSRLSMQNSPILPPSLCNPMLSRCDTHAQLAHHCNAPLSVRTLNVEQVDHSCPDPGASGVPTLLRPGSIKYACDTVRGGVTRHLCQHCTLSGGKTTFKQAVARHERRFDTLGPRLSVYRVNCVNPTSPDTCTCAHWTRLLTTVVCRTASSPLQPKRDIFNSIFS
jgi:hypothetical protein